MTIHPLHQNSGDLAPTGLTTKDQRRIQDALDSSTSANTRRAYNQAWRHLRPGQRTVAVAIPYRRRRSWWPRSWRSWPRRASRWPPSGSPSPPWRRSTGHQDPTDNEGVRKVMAGIARVNGRPQQQPKPLTETALAVVKATAMQPRRHQGRAVRAENAWDARRRGKVDVALLSVLKGGLLRRSEASALRWGDVELQEDGSARLHVRRSKTDPEAEDTVLYIGPDAAAALVAIMSEGFAVVDPSAPVFGLSANQIGRRVKAAELGDGFTGHNGRVGMAQDLAAAGVELPALMNAGRWKISRMPTRYTKRQAAGRWRWPGTTRLEWVRLSWRRVNMKWRQNLPDVSKWQPDSGHKENLKNGLLLTCQTAQQRIVAEGTIEQRFNIYNYDSGPGLEDIVRQELSKLLPDRYSIDPGVVNDRDGKTAGEADVLIRNKTWASVVKLGATPDSRRFHFPIESIYSAIEVKQTLGFNELDEAMEKLVKISP